MNMDVVFGQRPFLILFVFPIILSAYLWGLGPGLLSTLVAVISVDYFLIPPRGILSFTIEADLAHWIMLMVTGICISVLVEFLHRSRRQAEKSRLLLLQSEERYHLLIETTDTGFVIVDKNGLVLDANQEYVRLTGHNTLEEIRGRSVIEWTAPEDQERNAREVKKCLEQGLVRDLEINYRNKTGRSIPIEINATVIEDGVNPLILTLCRDITERKRGEATLRVSEERFRAFMDNNPAIAWAKDEAGRYVYFSETFEKRVEVRLEDWRGKTDAELWPPEFAEEFRKHDLEVLASDQVMEFVEQAKLDGNLSSWLIFKFPFRDAAGKRYVGGVGLDITERQQAEETIKASLQEKEVLLKEIYHRTKNNLQVVCSLLNLQAARCSDPQLLQAFQDTGNRIRSMAMVHEKLYQSKDLSRIDLKDYIKDLANSLLINYQTEYGKISLHLDLQSVIVNIDTAMPSGLLLNELISNAIKYAFPGERQGTIRIFLRSTADGDIELRVADDGVGLPPELDVWNTDSLGLKLIMNLAANQLQGKVEVRREQGTEFCIIFRELDYKPRI
jgi:PAS domain S-box-containing protein